MDGNLRSYASQSVVLIHSIGGGLKFSVTELFIPYHQNHLTCSVVCSSSISPKKCLKMCMLYKSCICYILDI